jgi:hypothetical protein
MKVAWILPGMVVASLTCLGCCRSIVQGKPEVDDTKAVTKTLTDEEGAALAVEHEKKRKPTSLRCPELSLPARS